MTVKAGLILSKKGVPVSRIYRDKQEYVYRQLVRNYSSRNLRGVPYHIKPF